MNELKNRLNELSAYIKTKGVDGTVRYHAETSHLVRCGCSTISLNSGESNSRFFITLQNGKKSISANCSAMPSETDLLCKTVDQLLENLPHTPEIDYLTPLKAISAEDYPAGTPDKAVKNFDSTIMVKLFADIDSHFADKNVVISGAFSAGSQTYGIINTLSKKPQVYALTDFNIEAVLQLPEDDKKELRASQTGEHFSDYQPQKLISHLDRDFRIKESTERINKEPAEYDIIFHADAFGTMVGMLKWAMLSGESYEYGMSMLQKDTHKIGSKVFAENITISDQPDDSDAIYRRPFGKNGVCRHNFEVVENGVLKNLYYSNKATCDRFGKEVNNDLGCSSLKLAPGTGPSDWSEVLADSDKPVIYVGFMHYMNMTNVAKGEFTGSSRFGTFLIENGKVTKHLYNLRVCDSFHRIFNNVEWLSPTLEQVNISNTYGLRNPAATTCPTYVKVKNVPITDSSALSE